MEIFIRALQYEPFNDSIQRTLTIGGRITCTASLQFKRIGFWPNKIFLFFMYWIQTSQLETSCTLILSPPVSVLCLITTYVVFLIRLTSSWSIFKPEFRSGCVRGWCSSSRRTWRPRSCRNRERPSGWPPSSTALSGSPLRRWGVASCSSWSTSPSSSW